MSTFLRLIIMGVLILIGKTFAAERPASAADLDKLQEQVRTLDKDIAILKEGTSARLEAQDKRLSDVNLTTAQQANHIAAVANQTTTLGNYIAITSIVITILVFAAGFITYISTKRRAEQEAKEWFEENSAELKKEIETLRKQAQDAIDRIKNEEQRVKASSAEYEKTREAAITKIYQTASSNSPVDEETKAVIQQADQELTQKPEAAFTAKDHYNRSAAQFAKGNYISALESIEAALEKAPNTALYLFAKGVIFGELKRHEDAIKVYDDIHSRFGSDNTPTIREQVAKALVNKGVALGQLNRSKDEIKVYDDINSRFGSDNTLAIREQVAMALLNKGVTLGQLNRPEEAIKVFHSIDSRFGSDNTPTIREQVAMALFNKGVTLGLLNRPEDKIKVYDDIDSRFGSDNTPAIRELVAHTLNGAGFDRIMLAKERWANEQERVDLLTHACADLKRGLEMCADADKAILLGNLGYALFLSGQRDEARQQTLECLQFGKEPQLEAQRKDTQQHRIEQQDSDYEALLTEVWEVISSQNNIKKS